NNILETRGGVHWSLDRVGKSAEPVVRGKVNFPDIAFDISITFRRNLSPDLAASHIFTLVFADHSERSSRTVKDFAGIELRLNPRFPGQFIKGLAVPLEPGTYAIALFKTEIDVHSNTELLTEYQWFTFPVLFENGQRGTLTFAKGESGNSVFKEAFDLWANGRRG
ncbi:MAG: hypothetical protein LBR29_00035, partial [Methylobacteriaceae bacterium]|nr:hypothetical protein [Methylobacteriaceae bacterium]